MNVVVYREACCAQDDQAGPLEAVYPLAPGATLRELVSAIERSGFLQYSSSHRSMVGTVDSRRIVRVYGSWCGFAREPLYFLPPDDAATCVFSGDGPALRFAFV